MYGEHADQQEFPLPKAPRLLDEQDSYLAIQLHRSRPDSSRPCKSSSRHYRCDAAPQAIFLRTREISFSHLSLSYPDSLGKKRDGAVAPSPFSFPSAAPSSSSWQPATSSRPS